MTLALTASADVEVYEEADETLFVDVRRTASGHFIDIGVHGTDPSEALVVPAERPAAIARVLLARRDQVRHTADHLEGRWFIRTNEGALNFKLVSAPDRVPDVRSLSRTLVPAREQATLEKFVLLDRGIAVQERVDADTRVRLLGAGQTAPLTGGAGTVVILGDNRDPNVAHRCHGVTSMVRPPATFDLHLVDSRCSWR